MDLVTMFKKLSAALVAMSLVAIAQSAFAQQSEWPLITNGGSTTILAVTPKNATTSAKVKFDGRNFARPLNGVEYFNLPNVTNATRYIKLNGVAVEPSALKPGMTCSYIVGWQLQRSSQAAPIFDVAEGAQSYITMMTCKG